jgi:hypothetical protein
MNLDIIALKLEVQFPTDGANWRNLKCDNNRTANKTLAMMNLSPLETVWMMKQCKN